ncbi:NAD(P)-dependent oxidoreductase [Streptomyces sp. L7]
MLAIFGANGYTGDAIRAEALRRGHQVLAFSRSGSGDSVTAGDLHEPATVKSVAERADVVIVAIPARDLDGKKLIDAVPELLKQAAAADIRVGFVGGAGSLRTTADGPLVLESAGFPPIALPEGRPRTRRSRPHCGTPPRAAGSTSAPPRSTEPTPCRIRPGPMSWAATSWDRTPRVNRSCPPRTSRRLAFLDEIETPKHINERFSVIGAYWTHLRRTGKGGPDEQCSRRRTKT